MKNAIEFSSEIGHITTQKKAEEILPLSSWLSQSVLSFFYSCQLITCIERPLGNRHTLRGCYPLTISIFHLAEVSDTSKHLFFAHTLF